MTMSEYEERFRPPAPSLYQTFAEVRGSNRGGRRSRRLWVAAALVGVMTITSKAALHHSIHADASQVWKSAIQACDFYPSVVCGDNKRTQIASRASGPVGDG
jgi:hypothetical protein